MRRAFKTPPLEDYEGSAGTGNLHVGPGNVRNGTWETIYATRDLEKYKTQRTKTKKNNI